MYDHHLLEVCGLLQQLYHTLQIKIHFELLYIQLNMQSQLHVIVLAHVLLWTKLLFVPLVKVLHVEQKHFPFHLFLSFLQALLFTTQVLFHLYMPKYWSTSDFPKLSPRVTKGYAYTNSIQASLYALKFYLQLVSSTLCSSSMTCTSFCIISCTRFHQTSMFDAPSS